MALPNLADLNEIPMTLPGRTCPQRSRDYLAGFQAAWLLAQSIDTDQRTTSAAS